MNVVYKYKKRNRLTLYGEKTSVESTYLTNNYYAKNQVGGKIEQQMIRRIFLLLDGFYLLGAYSEELTDNGKTEKRRDHTRSVNSELRFEIFKWLHITGGYQFKYKDSNFDAYDYKNKIYSGKLFLQF